MNRLEIVPASPDHWPLLAGSENAGPVKIAALIGAGSRLRSIVGWAGKPGSPGKLELVVSYKRISPGLEWAFQQGFEARSFPWWDWKARGKSRREFDEALAGLVQEFKIELVVLAGWGLMLSPPFLERFPRRVINIHPALLTETAESETRLSDGRKVPVFRGNNVLEEAWRAGVPVTGCSVHYVTAEMDVGPVILTREVPRLPGDSLEALAARVHAAEDELLPQALTLACRQLRL